MNKKGIALVLSFMVMAFLSILGSVFVSGSISESNINRRYANSTQAFWIAEAGLAQGYYNWVNNITQPQGAVNFGNGSYTINTSSLPEVTVNATVGGVQKNIKASFVRIPLVFENTLSVGGNLSLNGFLARVEVYGKTRISGTYSRSGAQGWFEDKQEGVSQNNTTIPIPDYNKNGTANEFSDFVLFGQKAVQSYPADEVVYIQTNSTVTIYPNQNLIGKKVIFVEGSTPGAGDVNILFDATWREAEDITIISTGTVTYVQPLQYQDDARLSMIAWDDYSEISVFRSQHESVAYAHDDVDFIDALEWGSTTGSVIANDDMSLMEILAYAKYYYSDRAYNGDLPPGFQWLPGNTGRPQLRDWQDL